MGRPLSIVLTPGQRHESTQLKAVLGAIRVPHVRAGRPRKRPSRLVADKGYSYQSCRRLLQRRGILHVIPERRDQRERRAGHPGRPPSFDAALSLCAAQRGRAVRQSAKAVAGARHALRETRCQL